MSGTHWACTACDHLRWGFGWPDTSGEEVATAVKESGMRNWALGALLCLGLSEQTGLGRAGGMEFTRPQGLGGKLETPTKHQETLNVEKQPVDILTDAGAPRLVLQQPYSLLTSWWVVV